MTGWLCCTADIGRILQSNYNRKIQKRAVPNHRVGEVGRGEEVPLSWIGLPVWWELKWKKEGYFSQKAACIGGNCGLDLILDLGTPYASGMATKKKKKKKKKKKGRLLWEGGGKQGQGRATFFFFLGCTYSIQNFLDQGSNPCPSDKKSHSSNNTGSSTR